MGLRSPLRDQLIMQPPRHGKVGEAVAVDVAHLLLAIAVLGAAKAVGDSGDSGPRSNCFSNQLARLLHIHKENRRSGSSNPERREDDSAVWAQTVVSRLDRADWCPVG